MDFATTEIAGLILPGLATGVGGLVLVALRRPSARTLAAVLGLTAGGAVEPPAALFAAVLATGLAGVVVAGRLAFAVDAMVHVVVDELIPEAHAGGFERDATLGLLAGFVVMMVLDNALG